MNILDKKERCQMSKVKNLAINCYSCIRENGKKINYMSFIKQMKNKGCNDAIKRIFTYINMED